MRFLLRFGVASVPPETLRSASGGESVNFRSIPEAGGPEPEVACGVYGGGGSLIAALSKTTASAMSGGGDVACFISGDRSLTTGVTLAAPSGDPRCTDDELLTSAPRSRSAWVSTQRLIACSYRRSQKLELGMHFKIKG